MYCLVNTNESDTVEVLYNYISSKYYSEGNIIKREHIRNQLNLRIMQHAHQLNKKTIISFPYSEEMSFFYRFNGKLSKRDTNKLLNVIGDSIFNFDENGAVYTQDLHTQKRIYGWECQVVQAQ